MLEHGGNLQEAARHYHRPRADWLDLSTGINPVAYPIPAVTPDAWHRLPEVNPALITAAVTYYNAPQLLPVAGTQAAIQALPRLRAHADVIVASPAYAEHAHRWTAAGHAVREVPFELLNSHVATCDVMVICNPNNPTGQTISSEILMHWADVLALKNGWLVVDEAFADAIPDLSVARWSDHPALIVLRSMGKFFGLAGLRLGFVCANEQLLSQLAEDLGPWNVSGPSQEIGHAALCDLSWQHAMRIQLLEASARLQALLARHGITASGTALFQWWTEPQAHAFWQHMAECGIWIRLFSREKSSIRLGLPHQEADWLRLEQALASWKEKRLLCATAWSGDEKSSVMKKAQR